MNPRRLALELPDTPACVDIRGMLLSEQPIVVGGEDGFVVRAASGALSVVGVVGRPPRSAIAEAVVDATDMTPVIVQVDNAEHVEQALAFCPPSASGSRWSPERAILHGLHCGSIAAPPVQAEVRLLDPGDPIDHLPAGLRFEIGHVRTTVPVAVAVAGGRPVSFCYPCWMTETLWDVSIDTLEAYRRRGLAAAAFGFMLAHMRRRGREPVWGAMASNVASLELARRLGFTPAAEIVVFSRGRWAYVTRGFEG